MFSDRFSADLRQARQTRTMMGTYVQVTVLDPSAAKAEDAVAEVFAEMARLETMLTRFSSTSPVAELNRSGRLPGAPQELLEVLAAAGQFHQASQGNFDVTVLPLLHELKSQISAGHALDRRQLAAAGQLVGFDKLRRSGRNLSFTRSGMAITLDSIAKGYIVDKGIERLSALGVEHALINAGGDIRALNGKGDGRGWQVLVQSPQDKTAYIASLEIDNRAVATSGNYEAYFDQNKVFGHIINPASPGQAALSASASVLAPTCVAADALATAMFVMGAEAGAAMIAAQPQCGSLLVDSNGLQHQVRFA
jgi:thiamine biosynthesis lipoprotein